MHWDHNSANSTDIHLIGFDDRPLLIIGIPVMGLLIPILFFSEYVHPFSVSGLYCTGIAIMYTALYWLSCRRFLLFMRRRFPHFTQVRRRIVYVILVVLLFVPLLQWVLEPGVDALVAMNPHGKVTHIPASASITAGYISTFFMISVYESIYFYSQLRRTIVERQQAKQAQTRLELDSLRNQVNPHFLFNSLSTLMNLIEESPRRAQDFLEHLSDVYRYLLEQRQSQLVSLGKELEFAQAYIFLLEERFRGNFRTELQIPQHLLEQQVVPLSLQILLENAIKHNVISQRKPLCLRINYEAETASLVVRNNLQRKTQVAGSTRSGLQNIQQRYAYFTQREPKIIDDGIDFTVKLPLLQPEKVSP